jgi:hypothetical protein
MFRYLRFYLTTVCTILIALGLFFGDQWLWIPGLIYVASIGLLDQILKKDYDEKPYKYPFLLDLALFLSLPSAFGLFFALFWVAGTDSQDVFEVGAYITNLTGIDVISIRNNTAWYHYLFMFLALTLPATGAGGLAGHELTHRTSRPFDLWLGRITLALNWGIAFPIEHVYGHHTYVATKKDPATATRGDSLYQHLPKAMYQTITNAWEIETARLDKVGTHFLSPKNVLLRMFLIAASMSLFAYYCAGWKGVVFHLIICTLTKVALEILNYVEHYGLIRDPSQPVQPRHSWNCNHVVSGVISYNLTRHSHHHADAQAHYQHLLTHSDQPEIPNGLMVAYLTTLIPPLWKKIIIPKLLDWDQHQAVKEEYELIRQANINSGWPELKHSIANKIDRETAAKHPIKKMKTSASLVEAS